MLIIRRVLLLSCMCFISGMFSAIAEAGIYGDIVLPSSGNYSKPVLSSSGSYSKPPLPSSGTYTRPTIPSASTYGKPVLPPAGYYPELSVGVIPQISVFQQLSPAQSGQYRESPHGQYNVQECDQFQQRVIADYGFTPEASEYLSTVPFIMANENWNPAVDGGAHWHPDSREIHASYFQDEAAVHEMAHAWYDYNNGTQEWGEDLAQATIRLSQMDPQQYPQYAQAIAEADKYVNTLHWADPSNPDDHCAYELYASFASFTMGQYQTGPRQLPEFMWKFYESLFTGVIDVTPYYEQWESSE